MTNSNREYEFSPIEVPPILPRRRKDLVGKLNLSRLVDHQAYQIEVDPSGALWAREVSPFEIMLTFESLDFVSDEICA